MQQLWCAECGREVRGDKRRGGKERKKVTEGVEEKRGRRYLKVVK